MLRTNIHGSASGHEADDVQPSALEGSMGRENTAQQIVTVIEEDVVLGRLHPMVRLIEDEMMQRFDSKRHVVRQALSQLENIGLVERIRNRGAFIRSYTPEEVVAIYDMRELLEAAAADRIPLPAPQGLLEALSRIQGQHGRAVTNGHLREVFRQNIAFHRTLFSACGNTYLSNAIEEYAQKAHAIRFAGVTDQAMMAQARDEHVAIIEALKQNDRKELHRLCYRHLQPSKERYIQLYRAREVVST